MGPKKNPSKPPPPHLNRQQPPQHNRQQQQPRHPVKIYHILPPKFIRTDVANFKAIVQRYTGLLKRTPSPPSAPPSTFDAPRGDSLSPASRFAATENANRAVQRRTTPAGILSPGPSFSPPSITPDFFLPVAPNNTLTQYPQPQEDELWNHQIQHHEPPMSSISHDGGPSKRSRFDFGGHDMDNYLSPDEDLYLHSMQTPFNVVGMGGNNLMMMPPSSSMSMGDIMSEPSGIVPPDFMPFEEVNLFNDGVGIGCNNAMTWHSGQQDLIGMSGPSGIMPQDMPGPSMSMGGNNVMMPSPSMSMSMSMSMGGNNMMMPSPSMSMSMDELMTWHNGQQDLIGRPRRKLFLLPQGPFSNTLFVEGFPSDCSEREVAHIFRHFYGFREVRLMTNYSMQTNVDPPVVCFAEFESPASAACALAALQGYRMDVNEHDSKFLQIQFFR